MHEWISRQFRFGEPVSRIKHDCPALLARRRLAPLSQPTRSGRQVLPPSPEQSRWRPRADPALRAVAKASRIRLYTRGKTLCIVASIGVIVSGFFSELSAGLRRTANAHVDDGFADGYNEAASI